MNTAILTSAALWYLHEMTIRLPPTLSLYAADSHGWLIEDALLSAAGMVSGSAIGGAGGMLESERGDAGGS